MGQTYLLRIETNDERRNVDDLLSDTRKNMIDVSDNSLEIIESHETQNRPSPLR